MVTPEQFNAWRVVPRILVGLFSVLVYQVSLWFMGIPAPTMTQAAFVSTVAGVIPLVLNFYVNSGKGLD